MDSIQNYLKLICSLPTPEGTSRMIKLRNIAFSLCLFFLQFIGFISSAAFAIKYISIDLENSLYAFAQTVGFAFAIYTLTVGYIQRSKISEIFIEFQKIQSQYPSEYLTMANNRAKTAEKILLKYSCVGYALSGVPFIGFNLLFCFMRFGQLDGSQLFNAYQFLFPWSQDTVSSWIAETILCFAIGCSYLMINGTFSVFFITICELHLAFSRYSSLMIVRSDRLAAQDDEKLKLFLRNFVQFHDSTKILFLKTANVFSAIILFQLISNIIILSVSMFELELMIQHLDMRFIIMFFGCIAGLFHLFLYCYYGHLTTDCYLKTADDLYESKWYTHPLNYQKNLILLIQNAQQEIQYHGFGIAYLNLNTYCKVIRTTVSYYMMFKTLTDQ